MIMWPRASTALLFGNYSRIWISDECLREVRRCLDGDIWSVVVGVGDEKTFIFIVQILCKAMPRMCTLMVASSCFQLHKMFVNNVQ